MGHLGKKIKLAKQNADSTEWSARESKRTGNDRCPACGKRYKDMSAAKFNAHVDGNGKLTNNCPDA